MTPAQAIAKLDRQIAAHGQAIGFARGAVTKSARGFVRGYRPEQLVGLITQQEREVIVSPSSLGDFAPRAQDDFQTMGRFGRVMAAEPIHMDGVLVRWNLTVRLT